MANNWFPLLNILIAQKKAQQNDVKLPQTALLGLFPGFQGAPVPQFLMTDAVVNNAIASKERDDVQVQKTKLVQDNLELTKDNSDLSKDNSDLAKAVVTMVGASITTEAGKVVPDTPQAKALITLTKQSPTIKKILLDSSDIPSVIKDFVVANIGVTATTTGIFAETGSSTPAGDPKKPKLAPTS